MAGSSNRLCQKLIAHASWVIVIINLVTFIAVRFSPGNGTALFNRLALSPDTPAALLSYMWIHIDLIHFLLNMLMAVASSVILSRRSFPQFMIYVTYLTGSIAGGIIFILTAAGGQSLIGASCGALALCGAVIFRLLSSPSRLSAQNLLMLIPAIGCIACLMWINQAVAPEHLAGLITGTAIGNVGFRIARHKKQSDDRRSRLDFINDKIRRSGFSSLTETERNFIFDNINR